MEADRYSSSILVFIIFSCVIVVLLSSRVDVDKIREGNSLLDIPRAEDVRFYSFISFVVRFVLSVNLECDIYDDDINNAQQLSW